MELTPTAEELAQKNLNPAQLERAVAALRQEGYVVLNRMVDHAHLEALQERMQKDLRQVLSGPQVPHNFVWGNVQQDPPPLAPFVFADIVANPFVVQITRALLGEGVFNSAYTGNTNLPGSGLQPVHVDNGQLWPNLSAAHPAAMVVVNVPLDRVDEERGSIELWPGSHRDTDRVFGQPIKVDRQRLEARRGDFAPRRCNSQKGSLLLRDMRLWHRGTPNRWQRPRFMLAMVHCCGWLARRRGPIQYQRGCEAAFAHTQLDHNAEFVDGPIDYLRRHQPYDYQGANE